MRFIFILLACVSLTSCSKPAPATIEEIVMLQSFATYVGALTYDEVCNKTDPKSRYDFDRPENVNLMGNQQMLAARVGGLGHIRNPEKSVEDGVKNLLDAKGKIETKVKEILQSQGCTSEKANALATGYKFYSQNPPFAISAMLDGEIVKRGGKVTSVQEIEGAGKPIKDSK